MSRNSVWLTVDKWLRILALNKTVTKSYEELVNTAYFTSTIEEQLEA